MALLMAAAGAPAAERRIEVPPAQLDPRVAADTPPHVVRFDSEAVADAPLLVWLAGTGGRSTGGPQALFDEVLAQGYRLVVLSYLTTPAVGQVCIGRALKQDPHCAQRVRQQRIWGDAPTTWIDDQEADAIVPRLSRLLRHLGAQEPGWQTYLDGDAPRWSRIVLMGQSQGGGHAAFLAQTRAVAGVLMFSGGWDRRAPDEPAAWYRRASVTPPQRWLSVHHTEEEQAALLARIDELLRIPEAQRYRLREPVLRNAHTEAIGNAVYRPLWVAWLQQLRRP